jgi:hypothetical protein
VTGVEIRSYRTVFDLERRIYRIDRLKLNPRGIPVRGVVYLLAIVALTTLLSRTPVLGVVVRTFPWYLRDLAWPALSAGLLTMIRVEGRAFHLTARALVRYAVGPRHLAGMQTCAKPGLRWSPGEMLILSDGCDSRMRRSLYRGPGVVLISSAHECAERKGGLLGRRSELRLRELADRPAPSNGRIVALIRGARLRVR